MNRQIGTLLLVLFIQCGMVAALYWPHSDIMDTGVDASLLPFNPDNIDEIHVEDEQGNEAVLLRMSDQWILPDLAGMPVDGDMLNKLIGSISQSKKQWPIATTAASRQRFQVAAYRYQRRLTLIGNGELLGTVYLGTSPGFRKVHARNDAQDAIYSIPFNNYEAPTVTSAWLDKSLLQIAEPEKISSGDYTILKQDTDWVSSLGGQPDERELAALLLGLRSLQVDGIADEDMQRTLAIAAPQLNLEIESTDGSVGLELFNVGGQHFVRSDKYDYFFTLSAYDFDRLSTIDAARINAP